MLYSRSADIGFAHYPKTAGHSLTRWFCATFPDAELVERHPWYDVNHLPVRDSLERLGLVPRREPTRARGLSGAWDRFLGHAVRLATGRPTTGGRRRGPPVQPCSTRIIGVVREPFEMLVSLFEYWRTFAFPAPPTQPLILQARSGNVREFLRAAVADAGLPSYEEFFDIDGPAAGGTRLLDFARLEPALVAVCLEFGIPGPGARLGQHNAGPGRSRNLESYRDEAGDLLAAVEHHFRWYYRDCVHTMVRGQGDGAARPGPAGQAAQSPQGSRDGFAGIALPDRGRSITLAGAAATGMR
ncbi:MAG: hypothetical protein ACKOTB_18795 [Planctomycetia bacterium]